MTILKKYLKIVKSIIINFMNFQQILPLALIFEMFLTFL